MLDTVDCDHLFRFPIPSEIPPALFDLLWLAAGLWEVAGDNGLADEFTFVILATGLRDLIVDPAGRIPVRVEVLEARWMKPPTEGACTGTGFVDCRCGADGFASTEAIASESMDLELFL